MLNVFFAKLKPSVKYHCFWLLNIFLLFWLMALGIDKIEKIFKPNYLSTELLKILGLGILSLLINWPLNKDFKKRVIQNEPQKFRLFMVITLLGSSFLYAPYLINIYQHKYLNSAFRKQLAAKITPQNGHIPSKGVNLTYCEFQYINEMGWFPKISSQASEIDYSYWSDNFLGDYLFQLNYKLPLQDSVDTFTRTKASYYTSQSYKIAGNKKMVFYVEDQK